MPSLLVRTAAVGGTGALLALSAACASNNNAGSVSNPAAAHASDTGAASALHEDLPVPIKQAGVIKVATDASYAPMEFFDTDNSTIIGADVDLGNALGQQLGVTFRFANTGFDGIIASLGSRYDLGMSSFTATAEREKVVDMVTYFTAGISLVVAKGNPQGITGPGALCGTKAAVEKGTVEVTDLDKRSAACTKAGKPAISVSILPDQNAANLALTSGRADVVSADTPVADYAVKQSGGQLQVAGGSYAGAPYGIAVPRTGQYAGFSDDIQAALRKVMANGQYTRILKKWGLSDGAISKPVIDGAGG